MMELQVLTMMLVLLPTASCFSPEQRNVTVKSGDSVPLDCLVQVQSPLEAVMWVRPDYKPLYVFFYRDGRPLESFQHPAFVGRAALRDPEMRDGDVSIILKNVSVNDSGSYEGHVAVSSGRKKRSPSELRCIINLEVEDSGLTINDVWNRQRLDFLWLLENLHVSIPAGVGLLILVIIVIYVKTRCGKNGDGNQTLHSSGCVKDGVV